MPISSSRLLAVGLVERRACQHARAARRCSSRDSAEKLLTKLSGFLISWAMPAVSWPSEASFSDWISRSCALRRSSSEAASSRVRACTSSNSRTFSIAITAWSAKVWTISIWRSREMARLHARQHDRALDPVLSEQRHAEQRRARCVASAPIGTTIFRVGETIGNALDLARRAARGPRSVARPGVAGMILEILGERARMLGADRAAVAKDVAVANADRAASARRRVRRRRSRAY